MIKIANAITKKEKKAFFKKATFCILCWACLLGQAQADSLKNPAGLSGEFVALETTESAIESAELSTQTPVAPFISRPSVLPNAQAPLNAISPDTVRTFVSVVDLVRRQYVSEVNDELLLQGAMRGVLSELDGYAEFLDREAFENLQAFTEGSMATVGIKVNFDVLAGQWVVGSVAPNSSAESVGIQVGDYLYQINDKVLNNALGNEDVAQLLSGIAGTQVTLVTSKQGRSKKSFRLQRTTPSQEALGVSIENDIVVIKLPIFTERTRDELVEALALINKPIKGMVLDIRNNPGGVLSSAISVASLFSSNESVVQIAKKDKTIQTLSTRGAAYLDTMPVMVLQNRYSASAAEVLSQALKNDPESIVVGEKSYGKGSIQSVIPLGNGEAVKLTTAHYLGSKGEVIDGVGIEPDVLLEFLDSRWIDEAIAIMKERELKVGMMIALPADY